MPRLRLTSENSTGGSNGTDTPLNLATRVTPSALGSEFTAFYFRTGATNTVQLALWDTVTGLVVPTTHLTGVAVVAGWNRVELPAPVALVAGREYEITVFLPGTANFWQAGGHFSSPRVRGSLTFSGSRFTYGAAFARATNASTTFYYIDGEFNVPTGKVFTGAAGSWDFGYPDDAALLADGWSFTSPGGVNSGTGTPGYTEVLRANTFEGGTAGTNVTAVNSGGDSGDAFNFVFYNNASVGPSGNAAITYAAAAAVQGLMGCHFVASGTSATYLRWDMTGSGPYAFVATRIKAYPGPPAASVPLFDLRSSALAGAFLSLRTDGTVRARNRTNTDIVASTSPALVTGNSYTFELSAKPGTTTTDGYIAFRILNANGTVFHSWSDAAVDAGVNPLVQSRVNAPLAASGWTGLDVDNVRAWLAEEADSPGVMGIQIPLTATTMLNSGAIPANSLFRQLPADWRSLQLRMKFSPVGSADLGKHAGLGLIMEDGDFIHFRIDYAGQPAMVSESSGDLLGGGGDLDSRGYDLRAWPTPRWLRIDRELDGHLTLLWSLNGIDWLTTYKDPANLVLATYAENIDANTMFITGGGGTGLSYTLEHAVIAGEPPPNPLDSVPDTYLNGTPAKIYYDGDAVAAGYMDGAQNYTATMAGSFVGFSIAGVSFRPEIELQPGSTATCYWTLEDNRVFATGLAPAIDFQVYAEREMRLFVTDSGVSAFDQVTSLNLGYDNLEDPGIYGPGAAYNHPPQPVAEITDLQLLTDLQQFMAAHSNLATIDFSNMANLEFIECFHAEVEAVDLTGCSSLQRLCLESCRVQALDLNPVKSTLLDLRYAVQRYLSAPVALTPVVGNMATLYHYCTRDQVMAYAIPNSQMPALEQRWDWFTGRTTSDTPLPALLTSFITQGNAYPEAVVNAILVSLDTNNAPASPFWARQVDVSGGAAPTGAGATAKASLLSKGWVVTTA